MAKETTPLEAAGMYWFIDTEISKNLPAARLRMREIKAMGFTEVWIAVRDLREIGDAPTSLLSDNYRHFLEVVVEEADHLGLGLIPFIMPCGLGYLEAARYELIVSASAVVAEGGKVDLDFGGNTHEGWVRTLKPHRAFAYRTEKTMLGVTVVADSVRKLKLANGDLNIACRDGGLTATLTNVPVEVGEEVYVSLVTTQQQTPSGVDLTCGWGVDVTSKEFRKRLRDVVKFHEKICGGHPCYIGVAFDEPNIGDPALPENKRERVRRFYWSKSLAGHLKKSRGFDLDEQVLAMYRPMSDIGYGLRIAYFESIQYALMDAMAYAMESSSVPILGTHNWVGDRDRAIYNTFDEMEFTHTRAYGATDISGLQWEFDYAAVEPLIAFAQKEAMGRERAMIMTDHFREKTDYGWLTYTCERHAALGVDYMMLHAFGAITGNPPLWTRTETWPAYREPLGMENYVSRMRHLAQFRDYKGMPNVLVIYPRYSRLIAVGDRYVVREWDKFIFSLYRAHYAPMTISQIDLGKVRFNGAKATYNGHEFGTLMLPYFTAISESQMKKLVAFHEAGGNLVFTKPNYILADSDGKASAKIRSMFEKLFAITAEPENKRFEQNQTVAFDGQKFHAQRLSDGLSEYDDWYLDFGGRSILEATSAKGGRAVLVGFSATALSYSDNLMTCHTTDTTRLLDTILSKMVAKSFTCADASGAEDYFAPGMLRTRDGELLLSVHRHNAETSVAKAGAATVYLPAGKSAPEYAQGINAFVSHVEEPVSIVYNPFLEVLREIDLGREIASVVTYDKESRYVHFSGSTLRLALPPKRQMTFASIEFGARDPKLAADITSDNGQVLEAWSPINDPRRTIVRMNGPEHVTLRLTLAPEFGKHVAVRCLTTMKEGTAAVTERNGRLEVVVEVEIFNTLESDVEIVQS